MTASGDLRETGDTNVEVTQLIADYFRRDASQVPDHARLVEDLGADSLEILEITLGLNELFGIELPAEGVADVRTVGGFCRLVQQQVR
jgi:acyl carrier protein